MKEITIQDIDHLLHVIDDSIRWASVHDEHAFPVSAFKEKRRNLKKIRFALEENCSAAAYGESQNGKSYLISSLLSNQGDALTISGGGWATLWLHRRYVCPLGIRSDPGRPHRHRRLRLLVARRQWRETAQK